MAKTVYGRLFGWIVNKINQLLAPEIDLDPSETSEIGKNYTLLNPTLITKYPNVYKHAYTSANVP